MRKITQQTVTHGFNKKIKRSVGNTRSTGDRLYLHGNLIAEHRVDGVWITNAGWPTPTTKDRLNAINEVSIHQKNYGWYLNGNPWDGEWVRIGSTKQSKSNMQA